MPSFLNFPKPWADSDDIHPADNHISSPAAAGEKSNMAANDIDADEDNLKMPIVKMDIADEGAKRAELMQAVLGKYGRILIFAGIGIMMIVYNMDLYTYGTYFIYAISDFMRLSEEAAVSTASNLTFALLKPIWAKLSDIYGRGTLYPIALALALIGLIVAATAKTFEAFAAGTILRVMGITALNTLNTIVLSDLTSTRARTFAVTVQWFPMLILPWCISNMTSAIVSPGGIGWAWGIGITAIIFPFGTALITATLFVYERRAKKLEVDDLAKEKITIPKLISNMDLPGLAILIVGCTFILVPLSIASNQEHGYRTSWVIALMILGGLLLVSLPFFESRFASHPFLPMRYFKHKAILWGFILYFTDYMAGPTVQTYLYNWAVIAQNMSIVTATNLTNINGVTNFIFGLGFGYLVYKTKHFKWMLAGGATIRLLGYGLMFRVRTSHPGTAEIFIIQAIQGIGDGIVQSGGYLAATVNVPHKETAQMAALVVTIGMLGSSVGTAIAGAIYTGTMREELSKALAGLSTPELINNLYNSITTDVPEWGTPERDAIAIAYNRVTSYFYIAAMIIIIPGIIASLLIPNQTLNDNQNLVEDHGMLAQGGPGSGIPQEETSHESKTNTKIREAKP